MDPPTLLQDPPSPPPRSKAACFMSQESAQQFIANPQAAIYIDWNMRQVVNFAILPIDQPLKHLCTVVYQRGFERAELFPTVINVFIATLQKLVPWTFDRDTNPDKPRYSESSDGMTSGTFRPTAFILSKWDIVVVDALHDTFGSTVIIREAWFAVARRSARGIRKLLGSAHEDKYTFYVGWIINLQRWALSPQSENLEYHDVQQAISHYVNKDLRSWASAGNHLKEDDPIVKQLIDQYIQEYRHVRRWRVELNADEKEGLSDGEVIFLSNQLFWSALKSTANLLGYERATREWFTTDKLPESSIISSHLAALLFTSFVVRPQVLDPSGSYELRRALWESMRKGYQMFRNGDVRVDDHGVYTFDLIEGDEGYQADSTNTRSLDKCPCLGSPCHHAVAVHLVKYDLRKEESDTQNDLDDLPEWTTTFSIEPQKSWYNDKPMLPHIRDCDPFIIAALTITKDAQAATRTEAFRHDWSDGLRRPILRRETQSQAPATDIYLARAYSIDALLVQSARGLPGGGLSAPHQPRKKPKFTKLFAQNSESRLVAASPLLGINSEIPSEMSRMIYDIPGWINNTGQPRPGSGAPLSAGIDQGISSINRFLPKGFLRDSSRIYSLLVCRSILGSLSHLRMRLDGDSRQLNFHHRIDNLLRGQPTIPNDDIEWEREWYNLQKDIISITAAGPERQGEGIIRFTMDVLRMAFDDEARLDPGQSGTPLFMFLCSKAEECTATHGPEPRNIRPEPWSGEIRLAIPPNPDNCKIWTILFQDLVSDYWRSYDTFQTPPPCNDCRGIEFQNLHLPGPHSPPSILFFALDNVHDIPNDVFPFIQCPELFEIEVRDEDHYYRLTCVVLTRGSALSQPRTVYCRQGSNWFFVNQVKNTYSKAESFPWAERTAFNPGEETDKVRLEAVVYEKLDMAAFQDLFNKNKSDLGNDRAGQMTHDM